MGILRFLLAASVLVGHSSPIFGISLLDAGLAVKTFFIISGFYMTLILTSKYHVQQGGGYWLFISNRFLRIYPSYLAVLALSLLFYAAASIHLHHPADRLLFWMQAWQQHRYAPLTAIAISQFSIFGLDFTPLFDFTATHGFGWAGSLGENAERAWRFNFLPHCWSVSVELFFYLTAPFLCLARRWVQVTLVLLGFAAQFAAWHFLSPALAEVATYHFFPFQFSYLLLGVLAFHLLHPLFEKSHIRWGWTYGILVPFAGIIFFYNFLPALPATIGCLCLAFVAVPLLFNLSRRVKFDRFIGDLSYPMYLVHVTCKWVILATLGVVRRDPNELVPGWELLLLTVLASIGLVWLVDYPVDRWRQARVAKSLASAPAPPVPTAASAAPRP